MIPNLIVQLPLNQRELITGVIQQKIFMGGVGPPKYRRSCIHEKRKYKLYHRKKNKKLES